MDTSEPTLTGRSIIGRRTTHPQPGGRRFHAVNPTTGRELQPPFEASSEADLATAVERAVAAFPTYAALPGPRRAAFLRSIAERIEGLADEIVRRCGQETALPEARLRGELGRTTGQLRMFADLIEDDAWRDPRVDRADPDRTPAPKPDVRSMRRALGPAAVFGASNFPLAFSVAGGDTASALAAGCPVIVKAHPSHPGTSELVGSAIVEAARDLDLPDGVFSLLFDDGHDVGARLVQAPGIRAVAFTGSRAGGDALVRLAQQREVPIPVYAEMGSVNPILVLPDAARTRGEEIADGLHASVTLGVGQFCTNPGVVFVPKGDAGDALVRGVADRTEATSAGTMLNAVVCRNYGAGAERLRQAGARRIAEGQASERPTTGVPTLWEADIGDLRHQPGLLAEVFGPSAVLVRYVDIGDVLDVASTMEGQLTATIHAQPGELERYAELLDVLADRAGRVIVNQFPTGVEVGPAMVHGGPYPATSDGRSTSVGTHAIERFTRLVAYQGVPERLLPPMLRD